MLIGCAGPLSDTYVGYNCKKSLLHFDSRCPNKKITKEEFEAKVQRCEKDLHNAQNFDYGICAKEIADILWCMGRVEPDGNSSEGITCDKWICSGKGGCDCSSFIANLKECKMKKGIFE